MGRANEYDRALTRPKKTLFVVDSFKNGISFGRASTSVTPEALTLALPDQEREPPLRSRYLLKGERPLHELELQLAKLSAQGKLQNSTVYFGVSADPFHPFDGAFDPSMKCLALFKKYQPGILNLQTRSSLLVIALPALCALGERAVVTIGIESNLEESVSRYTPGLPRLSDRLKAIRTLKHFGVRVHLQVAPVLPYGDWERDAKGFAQFLADLGENISVHSLYDGSDNAEKRLRNTDVVRRLAEDQKFEWLAPDSAVPLKRALEKLAPQKVSPPSFPHLKDKQLSLFVA